MFYPDDAVVPAELRTEDFLIRPLRGTDVQLDYEALMDSKEVLRQWSQSDWPTDNFTLSENLEELKVHEQEHLERKAFTFTIMNPDQTECVGCIYITPLLRVFSQRIKGGQPQHQANEAVFEAMVTFWVRRSRLVEGLDRQVLAALIPWFKEEWAFSRVFFQTNNQVAYQMEMLSAAGLQPQLSVEYFLYG